MVSVHSGRRLFFDGAASKEGEANLAGGGTRTGWGRPATLKRQFVHGLGRPDADPQPFCAQQDFNQSVVALTNSSGQMIRLCADEPDAAEYAFGNAVPFETAPPRRFTPAYSARAATATPKPALTTPAAASTSPS